MDIDLGHDERCEQFYQLCCHLSHFNHHHLADAESNIVFSEQFFHALWVARDDPRNRRVSGLRYAESDNVTILPATQLHDIQHRPDFVRQKNGELLHQRPFQLGTRLRQVSSHLNDGSATEAHVPR